MKKSSPFALGVGRTLNLERATDCLASEAVGLEGPSSVIEVDVRTGIAYTRTFYFPLLVDELSPWRRPRKGRARR